MSTETTIRTVEAKIEESETYIVRRNPRGSRMFCANCGSWVEMLRPEDAALLNGKSLRNIYRAIETGQICFVEFGNDEKAVFVCPVEMKLAFGNEQRDAVQNLAEESK